MWHKVVLLATDNRELRGSYEFVVSVVIHCKVTDKRVIEKMGCVHAPRDYVISDMKSVYTFLFV